MSLRDLAGGIWAPRQPRRRILTPFGPAEPEGGMLASISDFGRQFLLPKYVREMSRSDREQWIAALPGGARALTQRGAYSMFEQMQPFMSADFTAVTAASKTALSPDTLFTLPASIFAFPGKRLWFHASGVVTTTATPGTYTFTLCWGGSGGTTLAVTGAIAPWAVIHTNVLWYCDFWITARAVGALTTSLTVHAYGQVQSPAWIATTSQSTNAEQAQYAPSDTATPGTALADVASLDQTVAKALTLAVTPTVATGSIAMRDGWIVALN